MLELPILIYSISVLTISVCILVILIILKSFRLSGIIIYSISLGLFIFSVFIENSFIQFLTTSIFFVFAFIFVYYIIVFFYYRKKFLEIISITGDSINPFKNAVLKIEAENLPVSYPGIYFLFGFDVHENHHKLLKIKSSLEYIDKNHFKINVLFNRHGVYDLKDFNFIFRDVFGLTEFRLKCSFNYKLHVFPYFTETITIPFFLDKGGEEILQSTVKVNSTDFFENRKYYPGDDTRRINWKIFAHSGELHIREVEKIPPKIGQLSILYAPYSKDLYEYEYISSLLLATVNYLLKYDFQIQMHTPYLNKTILINSKTEKDFNNVINFSYKPFPLTNHINLSKTIVFASFEEFTRLLNSSVLKKNFCAVTFSESSINKNKILKSIVNIDKYDGLIPEIVNIINNMKKFDIKEKYLNVKQEEALKRKIELMLYRINDETDNIFK